MTTQTGQPSTAPIELPAGIGLNELVDAVARGVRQALGAQDDVGGYTIGSAPMPVILTMIVFCPPPSPAAGDPRAVPLPKAAHPAQP